VLLVLLAAPPSSVVNMEPRVTRDRASQARL